MKNYHSKIFWHFTGSPKNIDWEKVGTPKDIITAGQPKTTDESIQILKSIITTRNLLATCTEKVYGYRKTEKFCCVTDIPLLYLDSHREFYGDVAIGFKSDKIYKQFNPVLYIKKRGIARNAIEVREYTQNVTDLSIFDMDEESAILSGWIKNDNGTWTMPVTEMGYKENTKLEKYLLNHLKISTFSDNPGESFYQEKEWRKIGDFNFELSDIEAILMPKEYIRDINRFLFEVDMGQSMSILNWDLIVKS